MSDFKSHIKEGCRFISGLIGAQYIHLPTLPIGNIGLFNELIYKQVPFFLIFNTNENHKGETNS